MALKEKHCVPCEGGSEPLSASEVTKLMKEIPKWSLSPNGKSINREFTFKDYDAGISFVVRVAAIADAEGHHPDLYITYGSVGVELTTHAIGGLSENDFILAAKIDEL